MSIRYGDTGYHEQKAQESLDSQENLLIEIRDLLEEIKNLLVKQLEQNGEIEGNI